MAGAIMCCFVPIAKREKRRKTLGFGWVWVLAVRFSQRSCGYLQSFGACAYFGNGQKW